MLLFVSLACSFALDLKKKETILKEQLGIGGINVSI